MGKKSKKEFELYIDQKWPVYDSEPEIRERILTGIFHGLLLCVWSIGWIEWICGNAGLKPDTVKMAVLSAAFGILIEVLNLTYQENKGFVIGCKIPVMDLQCLKMTKLLLRIICQLTLLC